MGLRSGLLVPADSEAKLIKAPEVGADVVVLDLAESVAPDAKPRARELAAAWLRRHGQQVTAERRFARWVRINPLDSRMSRDDLIAVLPGPTESCFRAPADPKRFSNSPPNFTRLSSTAGCRLARLGCCQSQGKPQLRR
jgi:hypothetical protein